jgi:hypothetical protein
MPCTNNITGKKRADLRTVIYDNSGVDLSKPIQYASRGLNARIVWENCTLSPSRSMVLIWADGKDMQMSVNSVKLRNAM